MKLYYATGACSLAVHIVINELNLPCEYESVDLHTKKTKTGVNFLEINPKGEVPTLVLDNGQVLTENAVIQQYLADQHPSPLLPNKEDFRHYRVLEWLNFVSTDIHKGFGPLFSSDVPQALKESLFIPNIKKKFAYVDQQLANNTFLTGNEFALPDGYNFVLLTWLKPLKVDLAQWPNITRFFNAVKARPAVHKSLEEEGIKL
jgi:glutathione S-transferase